jgi:glutathione reductase (NADPH)
MPRPLPLPLGLALLLPLLLHALSRLPAPVCSLSRLRCSSSPAQPQHFDYLVIGGGSGGIATARRAASYGAKVAVIEKSAMGGTCVNVGCVPKKVMFNAASVSEVLHDAKHFGFHVDNYSFDWKALKDARDRYINRLNGIYNRNLQNSQVTVVNGEASFLDARTVAVDGQTFSADQICIAVGGKPALPSIPGVEHCINSNGVFALESQPASIAIVGAGYIGVELAGVFNALGTKTTILTRGEYLLPSFDFALREELAKQMQNQGVQWEKKKNPTEVTISLLLI